MYLGAKSAQIDTLALVVAGFCLLACQELKTRHRSGIIFKERAARLAVPGRHVACFRKRKENDVEAFIHARIQATEICTHAYSAVWYGICLYHGRGGEGLAWNQHYGLKSACQIETTYNDNLYC